MDNISGSQTMPMDEARDQASLFEHWWKQPAVTVQDAVDTG